MNSKYNQSGRFSLQALIIGVAVLLLVVVTIYLLVKLDRDESPNQTNVGSQKNQIDIDSQQKFSIRQPNNYIDPLIIATFGNILSISPVNATTAQLEQAGDNTIKYIDAYQNTDVEQIKYPNKLKESLILKKPGHPDRFEYQINVDNYLWDIDAEGNIIFSSKKAINFLSIKSDTGDLVPEFITRNFLDEHTKIFKIPAPYLIDAYGNKSDKKYVETKIEGNRLILIPDQEWLKTHSYPIILDPTIEKIPQAVEEVSNRRSLTGVTFKNDDGSFTFSSQIGNFIHYYDENNKLQPVNVAIQTNAEGHGYVQKVPFYRGYALNNPGYRVERKDHAGYVQEELLNIDGTTNFSQIGIIEGNKKIFQDVFVDTDFEVEFTASKGVKGNIILKSANSPKEFKFKLSSDKNPQFFQDLEQIVFNKLHVFAKAWDAGNTPVPLSVSFDIDKQIMTVIMEISSSDIIYPVTIDPDTMPQEQVATSGNDGYVYGVGASTNINTNGAFVLVGKSGTSTYNTWQLFSSIPIPADSTINDARLTVMCGQTDTINSVDLVISGDSDKTPVAPTTGGGYDAIAVTSNTATWTVSNWSNNTWYASPDIAAVVQEIVSSPWTENNDLQILIKNSNLTSVKVYKTWDATGNVSGPKLDVTYTIVTTRTVPNVRFR